jgi:hypothetical protein
VETAKLRTRPLALRVGVNGVVLDAAEVNLLVGSIERLVDGMRRAHLGSSRPGAAEALRAHLEELESLQQALLSSSLTLLDPPLELDKGRALLVRQVLSDIVGYQRGELAGGLRELRQALAPAS